MLGKSLQHSHMILLDFYIPLVTNSKDKIHLGILKALHLGTKKNDPNQLYWQRISYFIQMLRGKLNLYYAILKKSIKLLNFALY